MTNADKYLKDGVDVNELINKIKNYFDCPYDGGPCTKSIENFFNQPIKPTLTEDEKVILRNINAQEYLLIQRDKNDKCLFILKLCGIVYFGQYNHLFQFIQPRRRI